MAATIVIVAIALLYRVSAENFSTTMILPDFFFAAPNARSFSGEMTVTGSTTYYTLNCEPSNYDFWPGPIGCNDYSYTFSASSAITQYLMPDINLGGGYPFTVAPLQSFNQTVTIDCGPLNPVSTAQCMYTSLYNNENADDKSIISPNIVTKTNLKYESALYAVFFTTTTSTTTAAAAADAAAAAISTPLNFVASSTATTTTIPSPTFNSYPPSSPTETTATTTNPPSSTTTSSMLSVSTPSPTAPPPSNLRSRFSIPIDVSIGVSVGVCVLTLSLLLIAVATISKIRGRTLREI